MYTLLIVDDTKENLSILIELLGEEYDIIPTTSGEEALEIVREEEVDLILLDLMMPGMDGFEVCRILKEDPETEEIPVIFITAKTDEDSIERAYEIGGSDYVTKPFRPRELKARVKRELKLLELQKQLKLLATTDPLTGLYNRRHFSNLAQHILDISRRDGRDISILMIDIDRFKGINDAFGHQVGDRVLVTLSKILKENTRSGDIICRYGGEEFLLLLPNTPLSGGVKVAENLRKRVEEGDVKLSDGRRLKFTISLGVSQVDMDGERGLETAIKKADDALYQAKESGRNRVCVQGE